MAAKKFSPLFRLILKALKYFTFIVFGFALAAYLSHILGAWYITAKLFPIVFGFIWRSGIILLCLVGAAVLFESWR